MSIESIKARLEAQLERQRASWQVEVDDLRAEVERLEGERDEAVKALADGWDEAEAQLVALRAEIERLTQERDEYESTVDEALEELGIPTMDYPANVTNAWAMLYALRHSGPGGEGQ